MGELLRGSVPICKFRSFSVAPGGQMQPWCLCPTPTPAPASGDPSPKLALTPSADALRHILKMESSQIK